MIATSTRLNLEKVQIPDTINDAYFRRTHDRRPKKAEGDIFAKKKKKVWVLNYFPNWVSHYLSRLDL